MTATPAQLKKKIISEVLRGNSSVTQACLDAGISRKTYYQWLGRIKSPSHIRMSELAPAYRRGTDHYRAISPAIKNTILSFVKRNPSLTGYSISKELNSRGIRISASGVYKFLQNNGLASKADREALAVNYTTGKNRVRQFRLDPKVRLLISSRVDQGTENITTLARSYKVSRKTIYKWLKRLRHAASGKELEAMADCNPQGTEHYRTVKPQIVEEVLSLVASHPQYSAHRIAERLANIGNHGVQNILHRHNLNTAELRLAYAGNKSVLPAQQAPVTGWSERAKSVLEKFTPQVAPAPPPPPGFNAKSFLVLILLSFCSSSIVFILFAVWSGGLAGISTAQQVGYLFATVSLVIGMMFFAYSAKYYLILAVTLSFSRHVLEGRETGTKTSSIWGFLKRVFGGGNQAWKISASVSSPVVRKSEAGGLNPDVSGVEILRYPFLSVQLPLFNEKNVAKRLISAAMNMNYPKDSLGQANYEVIVCDDSNDETAQLIIDYAKTFGQMKVWEGARGETVSTVSVPGQPTLKVIHRPNREGFKGKALSYALKHMDQKTEFISIFDADFVPYPDSLIQFIKYFKTTGGFREDENYSARGIRAIPYDTYKDVSLSPEQRLEVSGQLKALRQKSPIAVVAGYQWHVLNKSENWITRGVRTEYAGSYVVERPSQEIMGAMKLIHGSVYCIRADILKAFDWGYSITEDLELTLRIYKEGFKVVYTPYIQAPSECVSTIRRLIRQRMRWAEGHSFNVKRQFVNLLKSPHMTLAEKVEMLFLGPYYLQSAFFLVGTFAWLISETVFGTHLPFWTAVWGWSLVLTNFFSLPLVNSVGLFMEEAEEKDYLGILSFIVLSYLLVPFQAYASIKGFIEKEEGPWFRTPKTGRITDILQRGRFYRWISGILPGKVSVSFNLPSFNSQQNLNPYLALVTANNQFKSFRIKRKSLRRIGVSFTICLLLISTVLTGLAAPFVSALEAENTQTDNGTFRFQGQPANKTLAMRSGTVTAVDTAIKPVELSPSPSPSPKPSPSPLPSSTPTPSSQPKLPLVKKQVVNRDTNKYRPVKHDLSLGEPLRFGLGGPRAKNLKVEVIDSSEKTIKIKTSLKEIQGESQLVITPPNDIRPGKFKLKVNDGSQETIEQEFTWGVLAVNTNKSIYLAGEQAYLQLGVLNEYGHTICDAKLELKINDTVLSTENGLIKRSDTCGVDNVTDNPDYFAYFTPKSTGTYQMNLKNLDNGFEINDSFEVRGSIPFEIERVAATRINPSQADYKMTLKIKANRDFAGEVVEQLPGSFEIVQSGEGKVKNTASGKEIIWKVSIKSGEEIILQYEYDAPDLSPRVYFLGPLTLRSLGEGGPSTLFTEARQWQIAADANCISAGSGAWTAITWTNCTGNPGGDPASGDTVVITDGHAVTLDTTTTIAGLTLCDTSCATDTTLTQNATRSLTVNGTVTMNGGSGTNDDTEWYINAETATVTGAIIYNPQSTTAGRFARVIVTTGTLNANGGITFENTAGSEDNQILAITGAGTVNLKGAITYQTLADIQPGTTSTFNYYDTAAQTVVFDLTASTYANLTLNNSHANGATLGAAISAANTTGNVSVQTGTFKNGGFAMVGNSSTFQVSNGAFFEMSNGSAYPTGFTTYTYGATSTVRYLQTGNTNIAVATYGHLELKPSANSITFTFIAGSPVVAGNLTTGVNGAYNTAIITAAANSTVLDVAGDVTIGTDSTLIAHASNAFTVGGSWTQTGTFTHSSGTVTFDAATGTKDIITTGSGNLNNVIFNDSVGSTTWRIQDPLVVDGNFTITGGTVDTVTGESNQINVGGNWTNDDIFVSQSGTVILDGATNANLDSGCADLTSDAGCTGADFSTLTIAKSTSAKTVTLTSTGLDIDTALNITTGILTQGALNVRTDSGATVTVGASGAWSNISTGDLILGGSFTNAGAVTFKSNNTCGGVTKDISISSTSGGSQRTWTVSGAGTFTLQDLTVQDQGGSMTAYSSTNVSGNSWTFVADCPAAPSPSPVPVSSPYYFRNSSAELLQDTSTAPRKQMDTNINTVTSSVTLDVTNTTFYILTDNLNQKWTASDVKINTNGGTQEQRNLDMATDSSGNSYTVWEDERNASGLGTFTNTGNMDSLRSSATATLLTSGKVLVTGGTDGTLNFSTALLFDPSSGTYTQTTGKIPTRAVLHTAALLNNGKVLLSGGGYAGSASETYDPSSDTFTFTGALAEDRANHMATLLPSGKVLITGGNNSSSAWPSKSTAELYDPSAGTYTYTTGPMDISRASHTSTLLANGKILITGGADASATTATSQAQLFDPIANTFANTGNMIGSHSFHTATLLNNGKVLITGGRTVSIFQNSTAELYDPGTGTFTMTAGLMVNGRSQQSAVLTSSGKILITGGKTDAGYLSTAELYDPGADTFTLTANILSTLWTRHQSLLLNNGKVLITGGRTGGTDATSLSISELFTPKTADIYAQKYDKNGTAQWGSDIKVNSDDGNRGTTAPNPSNYDHLNPKVKLDSTNNPVVTWQQATNSVYGDDIFAQKLSATDGSKQWPDTSGNTNKFTVTGSMNSKRSFFGLSLLNNGKVLFTGGYVDSVPNISSTAELFDPSAGTFSLTTGNMNLRRAFHTITLLNNGKVLVAGGSPDGINILSTAELFDPIIGTFAATGNMGKMRYGHTATLLPSGKVLVSGGTDNTVGPTYTSTAELFDPSSGTFTVTGNMNIGKYDHISALLGNGKVLVTGGYDKVLDRSSSTAQLYDYTTGTFTTIASMNNARRWHTTTLLNNGKVLIAAGSYYTGAAWVDQSTAELYDPATATFTITGNLTGGVRRQHTGSLLPNGKVLITGGYGTASMSTSELYDPSTGTFTATANILSSIRNAPAAMLLNNGKVLVSGGDTGSVYLSTAELYTPAMDMPVSNDGSPVNGSGLPWPEYPGRKGVLSEQRNPTLALDTSNNVFVAWEDDRYSAIQNWGVSTSMYTAGNEWYQTNTNLGANGSNNGAIPSILSSPVRIMGQKLTSAGVKQWGDDLSSVNQNNPEDLGLSATGDVNGKPSIVVDSSGNPIVTWESNGGTSGINSREYNIYSQKFNTSGVSQWGGTFGTTGNMMSKMRAGHNATLLNNGKVLISGGTSDYSNNTELYDPSSGTFAATGNMTVSRSNGPATTLLNNGKVLVMGGWGNSTAELYDPSPGTFAATGNMNSMRVYLKAALMANGKVLVTGGSSNGTNALSTAELYNPGTGTFTLTDNMKSLRYAHKATLLANGKVLVAGGYNGSTQVSTAELYNPVTGTFTITGNMTSTRNYYSATLLNNGKVLLVGGWGDPAGSTAEVYDPATGTFTVTSNNMTIKHGADPSGILLPNGKVLVAGGATTGTDAVSVAELYDPSTNTFTVTGSMINIRNSHTGTLLGNGKILITGGSPDDFTTKLSTAELYSLDQMVNTGVDLADQRNPKVDKDSDGNLIYAWQGRRGSGGGGSGTSSDTDRGGGSWKIMGQETNNPASGSLTNQWPSGSTGTFTATTGSLNGLRGYATATLLNNSKVLVTGGRSASGTYLSTAELYDPSAATFTRTGNLSIERFNHSATLLANGKVLVVAGTNNGNDALSTADLYDPTTGTFSRLTSNLPAAVGHTATLLRNGNVLVTGGWGALFSGAQIFNPSTNTFTATTGKMSIFRFDAGAALLPSGKVLITGGRDLAAVRFSTAQLYDPAAGTFTDTGNMNNARSVIEANLLNNGKVLVTGGVGTAVASTAVLYDPASGTFTFTGNNQSTVKDINVLLPNGKTLVAGNGSAQLYDPLGNTFTATGNPITDGSSYNTTSILLPNGKVLWFGGRNTSDNYVSTAELYNPAGEMMLSHDYGMAGNQENPSIVTSGTTTYAAWEDDRSAISNTLTSDHNIFMQKYDTNGVPQWPAASTAASYTAPYSVSDVRVDTFRGALGTQYSGKPVIGGVYTDGATAPMVIGWSDNRNSATDPMDVYSQSYDTVEKDLDQTGDWTVYLDHAAATSDVSVSVAITEWDGTTIPQSGQGSTQAWVLSGAAAAEDTITWTHSDVTNPPPSDAIGNATMRRLMVTLTRNSGSVQVYFDNSSAGYDSRLSVGTIIPEKVIVFAILVPFFPSLVKWWRRRRRRNLTNWQLTAKTGRVLLNL